MDVVYQPKLNQDDLDLLVEALEQLIEIDEHILEFHVNSDQTPETIEEFLAVVDTATVRIATQQKLLERLNTTGGVIIE